MRTVLRGCAWRLAPSRPRTSTSAPSPPPPHRPTHTHPRGALVAAMNPAVVRKTQETLGRVIKKPVLTEKLLTRPPFRFLRDILAEVRPCFYLILFLFLFSRWSDRVSVKARAASVLVVERGGVLKRVCCQADVNKLSCPKQGRPTRIRRGFRSAPGFPDSQTHTVAGSRIYTR